MSVFRSLHFEKWSAVHSFLSSFWRQQQNWISQQKEEIKCIELVSHFSGILSFRCFKLCIVCLQEGRSARWFLKACLKSLAVIGEQLLLEMSGYDLFDYTMYIAVHM